MSIILATEESEIRRISVKGSLGKQTLSATGRMAQVVKCLPRKCEALTSNPSTTKKNNNNNLKICQRNILELLELVHEPLS
jgi:hypothetical protein